MATAGALCGMSASQPQCDAVPSCGWSDHGAKCGVNLVGALAGSIKSTTANAYLSLVVKCGKGDRDAAACAAAGGDDAPLNCLYGPAAGSTNFIPKEFGGDGGDGGGGFLQPGEHGGGGGSGGAADMSCYPSYKMLMDFVAPVLGEDSWIVLEYSTS